MRSAATAFRIWVWLAAAGVIGGGGGCGRKVARGIQGLTVPPAPRQQPDAQAVSNREAERRRAQEALNRVAEALRSRRARAVQGAPELLAPQPAPESAIGTAAAKPRGTSGDTAQLVTTRAEPGAFEMATRSDGQTRGEPPGQARDAARAQARRRAAAASLVAALLIGGGLWGPRLLHR